MKRGRDMGAAWPYFARTEPRAQVDEQADLSPVGPGLCRSRAGVVRREHSYCRDGICAFCDHREGA